MSEINGAEVVKTISKLSKWKDYVIYLLLAAVLGLTIVTLWNRGTINHLETEAVAQEAVVKQLKLERDQAKANESICRAKLGEQNTMIDNEGKKFQNLQKEFSDLAKTLAEMQRRYEKERQEIMNQPTPKTCKEINEFINRNLP